MHVHFPYIIIIIVITFAFMTENTHFRAKFDAKLFPHWFLYVSYLLEGFHVKISVRG